MRTSLTVVVAAFVLTGFLMTADVCVMVNSRHDYPDSVAAVVPGVPAVGGKRPVGCKHNK